MLSHIPQTPPAWLGLLLVPLALCVLLAFLALARRFTKVHAEAPRKLVHISMGLLCVYLPWFFDSIVPVTILAGESLVVLAVLRVSARRQRPVGLLIYPNANRWRSLGDIAFPLGLWLLFWWAEGEPVYFQTSVLLLALADPLAYAVGVYCHAGVAPSGMKTMEGTLAFFLSAVVITAAMLWFFSDLAPSTVLSVGVLTGVATAVVEALSHRGLDNLTVPVACYLAIGSTVGIALSWLVPMAGVALSGFCVFQLWQFGRSGGMGFWGASARLTKVPCRSKEP